MAEVTTAAMTSWTESDLVRFLTKPFTLANGDVFTQTLRNPKDIDVFTKLDLDIRTFMQQTTPDCFTGGGLSYGASLRLVGAVQRFREFERQEASRPKRPASDGTNNPTKKLESCRIVWEQRLDNFYQGIDEYPAPTKLCDPAYEGYIAWPSMAADTTPKHSFAYKTIDESMGFRYLGRTEFITVYRNMLDMLNGDQLFLSGSSGTGKSHIVAAAVGAFLKERKPVVFIPDCAQLLNNPLKYVTWAMLTALRNDKHLGELMWEAVMMAEDSDVTDMKLKGALEEICHTAWLRGKSILFVCDHTNALDRDNTGGEPGRKEAAKDLLDLLASEHKTFSSCTPNDAAIRHDQNRGAKDIMTLRLGMDALEMKAFWDRYSAATRIELSGVQKERVEFLSGKLPILLTAWEEVRTTATAGTEHQPVSTKISGTPTGFSIMENQFWDSRQVKLIQRQIKSHFSTQSLKLRHKEPHLTIFINTFIACIHGQSIDIETGAEGREIQPRTQHAKDSEVSDEHLDLRYFFLVQQGIMEDSAGSSCGVAQILAMQVLQSYLDAGELAARLFNPKHIFTLIPKDHNLCPMGFIVEKVIVAFYTLNGIGSIFLAIVEAGGPLNRPPATLPPNTNPSTTPPIALTKKQFAKKQLATEKQPKLKFELLSENLKQSYFDSFPPPGPPPPFETAHIYIPNNPSNPAADFLLVARVRLTASTQVPVSTTTGSKQTYYQTEKTTVTRGLVIGAQVTIGKDHEESSDVQFYSNRNYEAIKVWMNVDKLTLGFLCITEKPYPPMQKPVGGRGMRRKAEIEYTSYGVSVGDVYSELGVRLAAWRRDGAVESAEDDRNYDGNDENMATNPDVDVTGQQVTEQVE